MPGGGTHLVQFYSGAERLAQNLASLYAEPLLRGETVVVVAASDHREALDGALAEAGVNLAAEQRSGRYQALDADEALSTFMTAQGPDADLFRSGVGATVIEARRRTGTVHAYGEMVGVLAARGDLAAALQLEGLWGGLHAGHPFDLLCGYPREVVGDVSPAFDSICAAHDGIVVSRDPSPPTLSASLDLVLGDGAALRARRAAEQMLSAWGVTDEEGSAGAVVAEMVAGAARQGSVRVTLAMGLDGGQVVLGLTDQDRTAPACEEDQLAATGRSYCLLTALTQAWGIETLAEGTRVWARLAGPGR